MATTEKKCESVDDSFTTRKQRYVEYPSGRVSVRTVHADLHSALRKLKLQPRFGITINTIYAAAEDYHPELQAQSAECRRDFVDQWRQP